jgi:predicted site-specific integrase-resolvase
MSRNYISGSTNPYKFKTPDLCERLGITRMTLYLWEKKGIFSAPRDMRGDRVFTKVQISQIIKAFNPGGARKWHFKG